jgi:hypothetical protein
MVASGRVLKTAIYLGVSADRVRYLRSARVPELADGPDLGSGVRKGVGVRVPPLAPAFADYPGSTTILPRVWPEATWANACGASASEKE